jgi:heat shock protein HtpX
MISGVQSPTISSVTGILCIIGLAAGAFFALSMLLADDRVARKVLHVILLSPGENQWLQTKVAELSKKLAITTPKSGFVENLRPNAFTIGYGKNATIVFSIGILKTLNEDEITAVAAHELAHVKNHDFFYKTVSSALTAISFFNPVAYLSSAAGQREREMLADKEAIRMMEKPAVLGNALAKICQAIQNLPKETMMTSLSSNLLVSSSVLHRAGILSTHPRLDKRLRSISQPNSRIRLNRRNAILGLSLSLLIICSAMAVSFATISLQSNFAVPHKVGNSNDINGAGYVTSGPVGMNSPGPVVLSPANIQNTNTSPVLLSPNLYAGPVLVSPMNGRQ